MIVLEATLTMPSWVKTSAWTPLLKTAYHDLALFWHSKILKKHFTPAAIREYGYEPRSGRYLRQKYRRWGHKNPLVWSGEMRRLVLQRSSANITSTQFGFRLKLAGAGHANWTGRHKELVAVSRRDIKAMQKHLVHYVQRRLRRWTGTVRIAA